MKRSTIPAEILNAQQIGQILQPISRRLKSLAALQMVFEECVINSIQTGKPIVDPFQLARVLDDTQREALSLLPESEAIYRSLGDWALTEAARLVGEFDKLLRAFCEKESYTIDGRYPSYVVDGYLVVHPNDTKRMTDIGNRSIRSLLVDAIAPLIREEVKAERARGFNQAHFVELLFQAYERSVLLQRVTFGDPVSVRKVYQELVHVQQQAGFLKSAKKSLFREYAIEHFARDLGRLLEASPCRTSAGKLLSVRPTSFPQDGIPISQFRQIQIVGQLVFSSERV